MVKLVPVPKMSLSEAVFTQQETPQHKVGVNKRNQRRNRVGRIVEIFVLAFQTFASELNHKRNTAV